MGPETVSSVLVREENLKQLPVYYLSKVLVPAEMNYAEVEKAALSVIHSARKLRHYFLAHKVTVVANYPLRTVLTTCLRAGRMVKWAIELGEHEINYKPRTTIKAQAIADLLIPEDKLTPETDSSNDKVTHVDTTPAEVHALDGPVPRMVYVDGAATHDRAGAGVTIRSPDGVIIEYAIHLAFQATNYELSLIHI